MNSIYLPGGMTRKLAEEYVGGRTVFARLLEDFPGLLVPFLENGQNKYYRRETLDRVLEAAELARLTIERVKNERAINQGS